ncbi:MAG TPA: type II toxin-antitoxin system HicB family antitoxin, partial [Thermomicrobiales bacterium]|nr:type II toxin-antitoxin system HicB family antitoxin [Thermomicrobiales bacterium]
LIPEPDEGGYSVIVPALPGCFTQGDTYLEAVENAKEAIECHLGGLAKSGDPIPTEAEPPLLTIVAVADIEARVV